MHDPRGEAQGGAPQTLGWFALVSYIPDPLARFLDDLHADLSPGCNPRAHVTVLPPRPLHHELKDTIARVREILRGFAPIRIEAGAIEVFEVSNVVYLSLASGVTQLRALYSALNHGPLSFREEFSYHPHITIAQDLDAANAARRAGIAARRFAGYKGPRDFLVSALSFVQHVAPAIWADVAMLPLSGALKPSGALEADASESSPLRSGEAFQPQEKPVEF